MRRMLGWLLPFLLCLGCSPVLPSATQYPSPVPSAAQPAAGARGDMAYARKALDAIRKALRDMDDDERQAAVQDGLQLKEEGVEARCADAEGDMPTLVCHFGPAATQPVAQGIFWLAHQVWEAQLYPQVPQPLAAERTEMLSEHGCRLGCNSGIRRARLTDGPDGLELLVVVDMGHVSRNRAEEVHLLHLHDGRWEVQWAPAAGDWNYGHAEVELGARGISHFLVRSSSWMRQDPFAGYFHEPEAGEHRRFTEKWMRKGSAYVMADRAEAQTPYSSLIRLVHHLSTGGDEKAAELIAGDLDLDEVRQVLAQRPKRQGWTVTPWGDHGFLLEPGGDGKPAVGVRFTREGEGWVLAEVWKTKR